MEDAPNLASLGWAISQAVLAAYWRWEDSGRVREKAFTFAELLSESKR